MKLRSLFAAVMASAMAFVACENGKVDLGTPSIALSQEEVTLEAAGGNATVEVTATRDWKVTVDETAADWLVVDPASGTASADAQQVTVSALSNDGYDREVSLAFSIGMQTKYLTVKQAGPKGSVDELVVYSNDFDIVKADAKPDLDNNYDVWDNKKGTGSSTVSYAFGGKISARTTGKLSNNAEGYSHYEGSGMNKVFFGKANPTILKINDITLNGTTADYILSFGCQKYLQDGDSNFSWDEFKVYVGSDSQKWVPVTMAFPADADINGDWNLATANLTLPAGTTSLGIAFVSTCPSAYSLDDVCLAVGTEEGQTVDFSVGIAIDGTTSGNSGSTEDLPAGTGDGTLENPYSAAKAINVASTLSSDQTKAGVYVKGIVKEIKEISVEYGNASYYLTDADGAAKFYVFRGRYRDNDKFTSVDQLKVGDEVLVFGDLINYMGNTPELSQGNYIVQLNGDGSGELVAPESKGAKTVVAFLAAADTENYYTLTGEVSSFDPSHCSFDLTDASGSIYVYSVLPQSKSTWASKIANGGTITIYGKYKYYDGNGDETKAKHEVVDAYIVSYTPGEGNTGGDTNGDNTGGDNTVVDGLEWNVLDANKAYIQEAKVNGESVNVVKLGTGSVAGKATLTVPTGSEKLTFYAVSWRNKAASLKLSAGGTEIKTVSPAVNDGAFDNPPYEITAGESDKFEVTLPENVTEILFETTGSNKRVIIFNVVAE